MYLLVQSLVKIFMLLKYKIYFHNKEKIPPREVSLKGGFIVACNHQYYWDPPIAAAFIKGKYSFMAKASLFENKLFAKLIRTLGAFPVVRGPGSEKAIQRAFEDLQKGRIFMIFPEGTRSKDGTLGKGKSGVAMIASMADAPVLPICLMYRLGGRKRRLDYAVGDMIPASELRIENKEDRRELKRVSERVMGAIKELQEQIYKEVDH
ncbi:MAG: 1-acyl-sn-glycerol-3-phosphate acyltransferase [Oscillospiraceae bacterium]|nr:1-acyl-sn-glycerol-3-phosphate acyltransferase [Oscillospiraceae bacterium]